MVMMVVVFSPYSLSLVFLRQLYLHCVEPIGRYLLYFLILLVRQARTSSNLNLLCGFKKKKSSNVICGQIAL